MSDWIIIVDDDITTLKLAGKVLSENGMRVTALNSGKALFDYIQKSGCPDLILLDVLMPDVDGFSLLADLRRYERENDLTELPVVFLTADTKKESENRGLTTGAMDYIRKPVEPNVLVQRIRNILSKIRQIRDLSEKASQDRLTGLLNKSNVNQQLRKACQENHGALLILDMDNFKLVNDLYGHEAGDRLLILFSELLKNSTRAHDTVGRIGGDEFIAFLDGTDEPETIKKTVRRLGEELVKQAGGILGEDCSVPLGVSAGAVIVKGSGEEYQELFNLADKALLAVKQSGKHDCFVWGENASSSVQDGDTHNIRTFSIILEERGAMNQALSLGQDSFAAIYRYMIRYIHRYHEDASKVLFTVVPVSEDMEESKLSEIVEEVGEVLQSTLRNSDLMTLCSKDQYFLLLPSAAEQDIDRVIDRVLEAWERSEHADLVRLRYETEAIVCEEFHDGEQ